MCKLGAFAVVVGLAVSGCAGLTTRKVPLDKRLQDQDCHVNGFRYYLSRPYVVISDRILVRDDESGILVKSTDPNNPLGYAVKTRDENQRTQFLDLAGNPIGYGDLEDDYEAFKSALITPETGHGEPRLAAYFPGGVGTNPNDGTQSEPPEASQSNSKPPEPPTAPPKNETPDDKISVVYLPDFEEQMAIKHNNVLASGSLTLNFENGWKLNSVNGSFDSTQVTVAILKTIKNAISAAGSLRVDEIKADQKKNGGAPDLSRAAVAELIVITRELYIEPGMYRINKQSEQCDTNRGVGLIEDMGIPIVSITKVHLRA